MARRPCPASSAAYPLAAAATLRAEYVGAQLGEVATPAVVLDRAVLRRNCEAMLAACAGLGVGLRAHVKSHKVRLCCRAVGETWFVWVGANYGLSLSLSPDD